jgi:peptidoglycan/LPS O-acetylase OafA/YrhL
MLLPFVGNGGGLATVRRTLPYYLTFNGEFVQHGPMTIAWSLGIEEKFYLLWPVLAFALLAHRRLRLPLTAVAAAAGLLLAPLTHVANLPGYAALLVGAAVALVEHRRNWEHGGGPVLLSRPTAGWVLAAAVAAVLLGANLPTDGAWTYVVLAPLVALLVVHLVHGSSAVTRALSRKPMRWLGRRSYGIYLIHPLALTVVTKAVPGAIPGHLLWVGLGCLLLTLAASEAAHRLVERPCIRWGREWSARSAVDRVPVHAAELRP